MNSLETENASFINTEEQRTITINKNVSGDAYKNAQIDCNEFAAEPNIGISAREHNIQNQLNRAISDESRIKIVNLLDEVGQLSDIEKLFLYVQLPTGTPVIDPLKQRNLGNPLGKKADAEILQTYSWIQTHLMEDPDVSLPKHEVYEEYRGFCESNGFDQLCAADFGKVMKHVFPSVKPRRLGTRGNSRYCYSGLRKRLLVERPSLPILNVQDKNQISSYLEDADEVNTAACHLIFEWAEKLLTKKFSSMRELALHLVENLYIDTHSVSALKILSTSDKTRESGLPATKFLKEVNRNRQKIPHANLHQKSNEKHLAREQKKKLKGTSLASKLANKSSCVDNKIQDAEQINDLISLSKEFKSSAMGTEFETSVPKIHISTNSINTSIQKEHENISCLNTNNVTNLSHNTTDLSSYNCTDNEKLSTEVSKMKNEETDLLSSCAVSNPNLDTSTNSLFSLNIQEPLNCMESLSKLPQPGIKYKHTESKSKVQSPSLFPKDKHETVERKDAMKDVSCFGRNTNTQMSWDPNNYELGIVKYNESKSEDIPTSVYNNPSHKIRGLTGNLQLPLSDNTDNLYEYLMSTYFQNKTSSSTEECQQIKRQSETPGCNSPSKRFHTEHLLNLHKRNRNNFQSVNVQELPQEIKSYNVANSTSNHNQLEDDGFESAYIHSNQNTQKTIAVEYTEPKSIESNSISLINTKKDNSRTTVQLSQLRMLLEKNLPQTTVKENIAKLETKKFKSSNNKAVPNENESTLTQQALYDTDKMHLSTNSSNSAAEWQKEFEQPSDGHLVNIFTDEDRFGTAQKQPELTTLTSRYNFQNSQLSISGNDSFSNCQNLPTSNLNLSNSFSNSSQTDLSHSSYTMQQSSDATLMENLNIQSSPARAIFASGSSGHYSTVDHMVPCSSTNSHYQSSDSEAFVSLCPSQSESIASSPFVSPRNTPTAFSKCAYNYEFNNQGNSRQFQNYSTPNLSFISYQPTPMPTNRLRHRSCQGQEQANLKDMSTHSFYNTSMSRSRHFSGPVGPTTPKSSLLASTNERYNPSYHFPPGNGNLESRTRCDSFLPISSASSVATESQIIPAYYTQTSLPVFENSVSKISNHCIPMTKMPINLAKQLPQQIKSSEQMNQNTFGQENALLPKMHLCHNFSSLTNCVPSATEEMLFPMHGTREIISPSHNGIANISNRCQSVPPNQMAYTLVDQNSPIDDTNTFSKSYPTTPVIKRTFQFPISDISNCSNNNISDSGQNSETVSQMQLNDWNERNRQNTIQTSMTELLAQPLDLLSTTLEDCDEFSKFAQN